MQDHTTPQSPNEIPYGYCHCGCGQKTRLSPYTDRPRGYVKGEPVCFITGHNRRLRVRKTLKEIFWTKVTKGESSECWEWQGARNGLGYGHLRFDGKDFKAHRVAYELHYGPIPDGLNVLHKCDSPPCCNWSHLFLGTHADNADDKVAKGRHQHGGNHPMAKVDERAVKAMRKLFDNGMPPKEIALLYALSYWQANSIVRRKSWKHI